VSFYLRRAALNVARSWTIPARKIGSISPEQQLKIAIGFKEQIGLYSRSEIITPTSAALVSVSTVASKTWYKSAALDVARSWMTKVEISQVL
jgi:hypothetical protein